MWPSLFLGPSTFASPPDRFLRALRRGRVEQRPCGVRTSRQETPTHMGSRFDRVAFVLSGGASLGAVQVGMLRALYERGIVPGLVVGTSVDAINGAFIASHPQTVQTAEELAGICARTPPDRRARHVRADRGDADRVPRRRC